MTHTTGRSAFLSLLKDEGITHLFGNPGTTELPVMHALMDHPELTYVMAMPESLVVAMADGFSRASGKLVACNVHVAPGLGNAMGSLYNAGFTGTPMILTAGQQEQSHGLMEPLLYGPLVQMAELLVKWAVEVTRLEDLPRIVRRAAKIATTPPTGPVFISLAGDILNAEADIELGRSTRVDTRVTPSREALDALVDRIYPRDVRSWWSATRSSRATRSTKRPFSPRGSAVRLISRLSPMARISSPTIHASWVRCRATNSKRAKFLRLTIS
jgi:benzoylformate decarboxylase